MSHITHKFPEGEVCVGVVIFKDMPVIATNMGIYRINDEMQVEPIPVVCEEDTRVNFTEYNINGQLSWVNSTGSDIIHYTPNSRGAPLPFPTGRTATATIKDKEG